jgi:hypothetical protein
MSVVVPNFATHTQGVSEVMRFTRWKVVLLVVCLSMTAAAPATAQLGDPLSLAASGVLLPFFSDPADGFVSIFELTSPVVPTGVGNISPFDFTNPLHAVFFTATCARNGSVADEFTAKQAKAFISSAPTFLLNFNGLAAIAASPNGNDLLGRTFPFHSRVHWIDVKTGRLRELEPITVATFLSLDAAFLPLVVNLGAGASIALPPPFVWNPLRSAATFTTPQESASLKASVYLICPRDTIQSPTGGGVFSVPAFPQLVNRDGSFGFLGAHVVTGQSVARLRARIYDDNETLVRDTEVPCDCLTAKTVLELDGVYSLPPTNLGAHTVPVWYTELESTAQTNNAIELGSVLQHNSFTGYWGLEVAGHEGTLFHRMSNASLDNLSNATSNAFGNR